MRAPSGQKNLMFEKMFDRGYLVEVELSGSLRPDELKDWWMKKKDETRGA